MEGQELDNLYGLFLSWDCLFSRLEILFPNEEKLVRNGTMVVPVQYSHCNSLNLLMLAL